MAKSQVKPLLTERQPPELYHRFFDIPPEPGARSHKVSTGEDWHILGMIFHISPDDLMYYNFHTTNPAYVNWYLREYVGCRVPDHRRMNWKFSNDADPGKIWLPPPKPIISQDITHLPKPFWRGSWGDSLDIPSGGPHVRTLTFEVGHLVIAALEGAGAHGLLLTFGVVAAPFAAVAAILAVIGGAYMDGFAVQAKYAALEGYAIGAVLGAKGGNVQFVQNHYFRRHMTDKKLQNVYNASAAAGFLDGRKLNDVQVKELFVILHKGMRRKAPTADEWNDWTDAERRSYNEEAANVFKKTFLH